MKIKSMAARCSAIAAWLFPLAQPQDFWRKWHGTSSTPEVENLPDQAHDGTSVRREVYAVSKQGAEVVVYAIEGGGHTWSGGPQYLRVSGRKGESQSRCHTSNLGFL